MRNCFFIVTLLLSLLSTASAAPPSFNLTALNNPFQTAIETKPAQMEPPHPISLKSEWWEYFSVEGDELDHHISTEEKILDDLLPNIPASDRQTAEILIARIRANLNALPQVKAQKPPSPTLPPKFAETYTVESLNDIYKQYHTTLALIEVEEEDIRQKTHAAETARKNVDTLLAAYLTMTREDPEKLVTGLRLMADRSSLAVADEQLRVRKDRLSEAHTLASDLQGILDAAQKRLVGSPAEIPKLEKEIAISAKAVETVQSKLHLSEAKMLETFPDSALGRSQAEQTTQEIIQANVSVANAKLDLTYLEINYRLQNLLSYPDKKIEPPLSSELSRWDELLRSLLKESREWQKSSDREFKRANEDLIELSQNSDEESKQIITIDKKRIDIALQTLSDIQRFNNTLSESDFLRTLTARIEKQSESKLSLWSLQAGDLLNAIWSDLSSWIHISLFKVGGVPVTPFGLLRSILIIIIALFISRLNQIALRRIGDQQWRIAKSTFYTLGRLAHYFLLIIGICISLASLGLDFTNLALVAGALSVGIGFGLQSIVNNFLSGIIILFEKNLKIGDFLELESGYSGYISEINVRSTILRTNDGIEVVIPNSEIISNKVVNWTMTDAFRRVHVPFSVAYGTDKELVKKIVLEAAERVPHTLKGQVKYRGPEIQMTKFGDSGLCFDLVVWVDARASKHVKGSIADYLWEIDNVFRQHKIEVPFPQHEIRVKKHEQDEQDRQDK